MPLDAGRVACELRNGIRAAHGLTDSLDRRIRWQNFDRAGTQEAQRRFGLRIDGQRHDRRRTRLLGEIREQPLRGLCANAGTYQHRCNRCCLFGRIRERVGAGDSLSPEPCGLGTGDQRIAHPGIGLQDQDGFGHTPTQTKKKPAISP